MNTNLSSTTPSQLETDCLVVVILDRGELDRGKKDTPSPSIESTDNAVREAAKDVIAGGEVTAKSFETTLLHRPAGLKAKRLLLVGGGEAKTFSAAELRQLAGVAARTLKAKSIRSFAFVVPESAVPPSDGVRAIVEGAFVGNFEPGYYKSDRKKEDQKIDAITIVVQGDLKPLENTLQAARIVAESQAFSRDLTNEPSNRMTPTIMAERAKKMASEVGLSCEAHGADKIKALKMGAFWGVAQGSDEPPALIVLRYDPPGASDKVHLGLVGKGVTFDTGGISIKPADGMEKMKYDMAGGAAMIGTMRALAQLKPPPEHVVVDGLAVKSMTFPQTAIVGGDALSYSIGAASILAKVSRDRVMMEMDAAYPGYGFAEHKGYGTPDHMAAIKALGACPLHRQSFAPFRRTQTELFG